MPNTDNILAHRWRPGCPSPNPGGRPSSKLAIRHALSETNDGQEIVERLVGLMRHARQESVRLRAACELRDWLFGKPSSDTADIPTALRGLRGGIFAAAFGQFGGDDDSDDTAGSLIEIESQPAEGDDADTAPANEA